MLGRDDAKRELQAGAVMQICDDALNNAKARHPHFPGDLSAIGTILAEELFEVTTAGMAVMQAINDGRDESKALGAVITELTHVHAVVERALERLTYERQRS